MTPYRTASAPRTTDILVTCRACGVAHEAAFADAEGATFVCTSCKLEQPTLRGAEEMALEAMEYVHREDKGSYGELAPFLRSMGQEGTALAVTVTCDGIHQTVSLSINSGSVVGSELVALTNGLPEMVLVVESDAHREAMKKGVVVEPQTGDGGFDQSVFIESSAASYDVRIVLSSPAVRAAIRALLDVGLKIVVTPTYVKTDADRGGEPYEPKVLRERLGWLRIVAGAPRAKVGADVVVPLRASLAKVGSYLVMPFAVLFCVMGATHYTPVMLHIYLAGAAIGFVVFLVVAFVVAPRVFYGQGTALRDIKRMRTMLAGALPLLGAGLLTFLNGALDPSPARVHEFAVLSATVDDDHPSDIDVRTQDETGATHTFSFKASVPPSPTTCLVRVVWHAGAFGWTWHAAKPELLVRP